MGDVPADDIRRHVEEGKVIPIREDVLGPAAVLKHVDYAPFELGFDLEKTKASRVFTGVLKGSNAYKARLRDGQRWVSGGVAMVPTILAEVEVRDGDLRRTIKFYPASSEKIRLPQFAFKPGLAAENLKASLFRCKAEK
jgi:hypothetical protein